MNYFTNDHCIFIFVVSKAKAVKRKVTRVEGRRSHQSAILNVKQIILKYFIIELFYFTNDRWLGLGLGLGLGLDNKPFIHHLVTLISFVYRNIWVESI